MNPMNSNGTEIFSLLLVSRLCVGIGRQLNESKRLEPLRSRSICRLEHIEADSSGKVVTKWSTSSEENAEAVPEALNKELVHSANLLSRVHLLPHTRAKFKASACRLCVKVILVLLVTSLL
jgi:hypothetical protein